MPFILTPALTVSFWAHMTKKFNVTVVEKDDAALMQAAAVLLDALDIQSKEQFLHDFATTLHRTIYIPFKIGVEEPKWPLWTQVRTCGHECQHVIIGERVGWATYDACYIASSSFRAGYEAECYGADMEMEFWRLGPTGFDPYTFAQERPLSLKHYGCKDTDIEQAQAMLAIRAGIVAQGAVETLAAREAIDWFEVAALVSRR